MDYIIALWFHQVLQDGDEGVIAINAWYDMDYRNILYPNFGLFRNLLLDGDKNQDDDANEDSE